MKRKPTQEEINQYPFDFSIQKKENERTRAVIVELATEELFKTTKALSRNVGRIDENTTKELLQRAKLFNEYLYGVLTGRIKSVYLKTKHGSGYGNESKNVTYEYKTNRGWLLTQAKLGLFFSSNNR